MLWTETARKALHLLDLLGPWRLKCESLPIEAFLLLGPRCSVLVGWDGRPRLLACTCEASFTH